MRGLGSAAIAAIALLLSVSAVFGQSPSPSPSPTPEIDAKTAFAPPWQALSTPPPGFEASLTGPLGSPDASIRRGGVRARLWVTPSRPVPGEPVAMLLRVTNVSARPVFHPMTGCTTTTFMQLDASRAMARGEPQSGNRAAFKEWLAANMQMIDADYWPPEREDGVVTTALADCGIQGPPASASRMDPGETRSYRWWWMPRALASQASRSIVLPLGSGPVSLTATWLRSPGRSLDFRDGWLRRAIRVSITATITLDAPSTVDPSILELADIALADPSFRAWVEADPDRASWEEVGVTDWHYPDGGDATPPPPGPVIEVSLDRWTGPGSPWEGIARVDAAAHRVIDVQFECAFPFDGCPTPAWPASASPSPGEPGS